MRLVFNRSALIMPVTLGVAFISLIILPTNSFAVVEPVRETTAKTITPFCLNINKSTTEITGRMTELSNKLTQAWTNQDLQLTTKLQQIDTDVATRREQASVSLKENFTKLEAKATTDNQKMAVTTYKAAVSSAVSTRRAAYDSARQIFRDAVKAVTLTRRDEVSAQLTSFATTVDTAISTAKNTCTGNGKTGNAVHEAYQNSLKTAKNSFQEHRSSDEKIKGQIGALAATRDATFASTNVAFKASLELAKKDLQAAFDNSSEI